MSGTGNTVVRGGYGMFYGRIINSTISNAITNVGSARRPAGAACCRTRRPARRPSRTSSRAPRPRRCGRTSSCSQDNAQNPLVHEYDLILEHRIAANTLVSVSYVGSAGRNLPLFIDANLPAPSGTVTYQTTRRAARRPGADDAAVHRRTSEPELQPHHDHLRAGEVAVQRPGPAVNRRLSGGLQLQASYTEARATDNGQSSQTFTNANNVLNPLDIGLEEGTSNFEIRHRFVANAIWNTNAVGTEGSMTHTLFSGFTIAPTFVMTSGIPYTATLTGNTPNTAACRPASSAPAARTACRRSSAIRYHLPSTANVDLRVSRGFSVGGTHKLEAILDVFNVFNRLNHTQANQSIYAIGGTVAAPTLTYNPTFGTLTNANSNYFVFTPRQVQLALRYSF